MARYDKKKLADVDKKNLIKCQFSNFTAVAVAGVCVTCFQDSLQAKSHCSHICRDILAQMH